MLLEFRLRNFRSYAAEKRFSMVAGPGKELPDNTMTVAGYERHPLLRSAAIYGANASGKSNLIQAFAFLRSFVLRSADPSQEEEEIPVSPFLLDAALVAEPSEFEISFLFDGVRHQYGFVVSRERIHEEWLIVYPRGKAQEWFHREVKESGESDWTWSRTHLKGDKVQLGTRTTEKALFLSVAAQWNHPQLRPIQRWFRNRLKVLPRNAAAMNFTRNQMLKDRVFCDWMTNVLKAADVGISRVMAREIDKPWLPPSEDIPPRVQGHLLGKPPKVEVKTSRRIPRSGREVEWDLSQESDGTQRMFELLGPIRDVLEKGSILIMDELDTSLHAYITHAVVQLFNRPATNPDNAQLIFTTHDTSLLDLTVFRRDQIWFTDKDESGTTDLYSLLDYSPRKGEAVQKGYLAGRYGAVPIMSGFELVPSGAHPARSDAAESEG